MADLDWHSLQVLDDAGLGTTHGANLAAIAAKIPALEADLDAAMATVHQAVAPVPPGTPGDDQDDGVAFQHALLATGARAKLEALSAAKARAAQLHASNAPEPVVAGWVLIDAHAHLKNLGLTTPPARAASQPATVMGGLTVAEVVWEARNQDQHWNDAAKPLNKNVIRIFTALVQYHPQAFGVAAPPATEADLQALLHQRSYADVVLSLLGWTSSASVNVGAQAIVP